MVPPPSTHMPALLRRQLSDLTACCSESWCIHEPTGHHHFHHLRLAIGSTASAGGSLSALPWPTTLDRNLNHRQPARPSSTATPTPALSPCISETTDLVPPRSPTPSLPVAA